MCQTTTKPDEADPMDGEVDEATTLAGGVREAIEGLILGRRELQAEARNSTSAGYVRRKLN